MPNIDLRGPSKVRIIWTRETPRDDSSDRPDERNDGFWPSRDPEAAGYVLPENFDEEQSKAQERMDAWENDDWEYVGVVAVAEVYIPIGGNSYAIHTFRSGGLWGIESDAGEYLNEVFKEEKAELLGQLKTLGAALATDDYIDQSDGKSAVAA